MVDHMVDMDISYAGSGDAKDRERKARTIARAFAPGRWLQGYVRGKLLADPVFDVALAAISGKSGCVKDLGSGLGLLGLWLKAHGHSNAYSGCDLGGWKIEAGQAAARRLAYGNITLHEGDMLEFSLENSAVICAFDVLHYLPEEQQKKMVRRLAQAARNGSLILVRNGVRGCGWRSFITLLEEWWTRCSGWISGGQINFPSLESLITEFEKEGCSVEAHPLWGKTPFSSYLLRVVSQS